MLPGVQIYLPLFGRALCALEPRPTGSFTLFWLLISCCEHKFLQTMDTLSWVLSRYVLAFFTGIFWSILPTTANYCQTVTSGGVNKSDPVRLSSLNCWFVWLVLAVSRLSESILNVCLLNKAIWISTSNRPLVIGNLLFYRVCGVASRLQLLFNFAARGHTDSK